MIGPNAVESTCSSTPLCCKQLIQRLKCFFNFCQLLTVTWSHCHYCNQTSRGHIDHDSAPQPSSFPLVIVIVGVTRFIIIFLCNKGSHPRPELLHSVVCCSKASDQRQQMNIQHIRIYVFFKHRSTFHKIKIVI